LTVNPYYKVRNYFLDSDTLSLVTDINTSKNQFRREGEILKLNFISLERRDERYFPPCLE
jgi:hypothetical protein